MIAVQRSSTRSSTAMQKSTLATRVDCVWQRTTSVVCLSTLSNSCARRKTAKIFSSGRQAAGRADGSFLCPQGKKDPSTSSPLNWHLPSFVSDGDQKKANRRGVTIRCAADSWSDSSTGRENRTGRPSRRRKLDEPFVKVWKNRRAYDSTVVEKESVLSSVLSEDDKSILVDILLDEKSAEADYIKN